MLIRSVHAEETSALASLLALAFRDNPLNRAAIRGDARRRLRSNRAGMSVSLGAADFGAEIRVAAAEDGLLDGGLVALPPSRWPPPPPALFDQLRLLAIQGLPTVRRWGEVHQTLQTLHPREPHWYLWLLGVGPERRRVGIGSALLDSWLEGVDHDRSPAYLETDRRQNLGFYGRAGFEILRENEVLGTRFWSRWRPAAL